MNWNDSLYWYWRERGGDFFASAVKRDSGVLFLDMPQGPAFIQCEAVSDSSGKLRREITVTLRASLERPYYLTVRRESFSGAERERPDGWETDGGVPELTARRSVRSSDGVFTPYLLQNQHLQRLLYADPGAWLQISPLQTGGGAAGRDEPNQRKLYAESGFREQMDGMVDLAQTARDRVNLWLRQRRKPDGDGGSGT